ncbi:SusC/RagA family TonB-linked outer membrane protein [Galbibacter pacificus]|uniref:TonB-dependent receptor n=1 Tax=Galbibacter pacificus TaxID=2996052 RepID=A0ABT6FP18_9FLAO|nr:TonB-dependent receptor [Galbibacter pacificus]MDG3581520.1 TonB-dependent receptor [Galbibacter pacificus]MDG3584998.1 TonB-dependent receptor [Galbibacter pacificus]
MKNHLLTFLLFCCITAFGQQTITGVITDDQDMPLPGASVLIKGTTTGTQTDFDGNYSIEANTGDILVFSYVGMDTQEIVIENSTEINISLTVSTNELDEVVVIGYGTQKSKDLTSAITTVKSEEIEKTPAAQPMQALQGKVAGLQIVNNGTPGQSPTVRIRGVGSYATDESGPLYVVDGGFYDNIDFLNPSDIKSISVLKDASAAAIYGVRAANGVVLIETKSGSINQKPQLTYDGYTGYQIAQNVVKMANTEQFVQYVNETGLAADMQFVDNAMQRYGRSRVNPNIPNVNTDWYDEIIRPATITNHNIGLSGGGESATYALGVNYFEQEGLLNMKNEYERLNLRSKIDFKVNDWLKVGGNTVFSNAVRYNPEASAWRQAYYAVPTLPVYDELNTEASPIPYANAKDLGYRNGQNPFPTMEFAENRDKIRNILANFYAEISIIPNKLTFKTAYNHSFETVEARNLRFPYTIGQGVQRVNSEITKENRTNSNQIWDNTLTYDNSFGKHNITLLAGTSFRDESYEMLKAKGIDFPYANGEQAYYIDQAQTIDVDGVGDDGKREYGLSYFGRIAYNFDSRYLLYGTFRADGTNKYQEKWGYFPTVGAGWVISEESFFPENDVLNFLKLRGSWGKLGNDNVASSEGALTSTVVTTDFGDVMYSGLQASNDFTALRWELTEEINAGLSARLFNNNLSLEADYFRRDTKNAVIPVSRLLIAGETRENVGEIRNEGVEVSLNWSKQVSDDFSYGIGGNLSTLKNKILSLGGQEYLNFGSSDFQRRSIVGETLFAFYGLEVDGVYQNDAEIQADPIAIDNGLVPGDFKFKDRNGDGIINGDDRTVLGSFIPTYSYGFNFNLNYKNFDFSLSALGQGGNKILNRKRGEYRYTPDTNVDRDFFVNRWHGEGTSNSYPSSGGLRKPWNYQLNTFYVEDGDFFRIQNITLGYTIKKEKIPQTRIYFTAEKPLTIFKYNGFNPEVPDGFDNQTYPVPAIYTLGVNIKI